MLVLGRKERETIVFPTVGIRVEVVRVRGQVVKLGIDAPETVPIVRGEMPGIEGLRQPPTEETSARRLTQLREQVVCRLTRASELLNGLDRLEPEETTPPGLGGMVSDALTSDAARPGSEANRPPTAESETATRLDAPQAFEPVRPRREATTRPSRRRMADLGPPNSGSIPTQASASGDRAATSEDGPETLPFSRPRSDTTPRVPSPTGPSVPETVTTELAPAQRSEDRRRSRQVRELYLLLQEIEQAVSAGTEEPFIAHITPRVLVVGGRATERQYLTDLLTLQGLEAEALAVLDADLIVDSVAPPDAILLDRATDPDGSPVVTDQAVAALAGQELPGTVWLELRDGGEPMVRDDLPITATLPKPVSGADLVMAIRRHLQAFAA